MVVIVKFCEVVKLFVKVCEEYRLVIMKVCECLAGKCQFSAVTSYI